MFALSSDPELPGETTRSGTLTRRLFFDSEFRLGLREMTPLAIALFPIGLVIGAVGEESGLDWPLALLMGVLVHAGPAQLLSLTLIAEQATIGAIVAATALANLRYTLYATSLAPFFSGLSKRRLAGLAHLVVDGAYAVTISHCLRRPNRPRKHIYFLASIPQSTLPWLVGLVLGAILATRVPDLLEWGLGFAAPAIFIGLLVPLVTNRVSGAVAIASATIAVIAAVTLPAGVGIVVAILAAATLGAALEWKPAGS